MASEIIIEPIKGLTFTYLNESNDSITLMFINDGSYTPATHPTYGTPKIYAGDLVEFWFPKIIKK